MEKQSTIQKTMRDILEAESNAIATIPVTDAYDRAVNLIIHRVHRQGGKLRQGSRQGAYFRLKATNKQTWTLQP